MRLIAYIHHNKMVRCKQTNGTTTRLIFCTGCLACFRRLKSHPLASWGSGSEASRALISERGALTCLPGSFGVQGTAHRTSAPGFVVNGPWCLAREAFACGPSEFGRRRGEGWVPAWGTVW